MDKLEKALNRLSHKEQILIKELLTRLSNDEVLGLDIVKLKARDNIFRLRKGDLRIIFRRVEKNIFVLAIERRSEKTYRNF